MADLFESGRIIDLILVLIAVEVLGLVALRRALGRGPTIRRLGGTILSGVFLMLAVRTALADAPWTWTAACLIGALGAHVTDLWGRWTSVGSDAT